MKRLLHALTAAIVLAPVTAVHAITINYNASIVHETNAFASFNTSGAEMAGMGVHVEYTDGSFYDATWLLFSAGFGGVMNNSSLPFRIQAGNTGTTGFSWLLFNASTTLGIRSVSLDGQPGNTVFDVSFPFGSFAGFGFVGTAGTAGGRELDLHSTYRTLFNGITISYSDAVALTGAAPVGDVFRRMTIEFAPTRPLGAGRILEFGQDTDSLAFGSVLAPVSPAAVPEGGTTLSMVCAGLLGLVACARRRTEFSSPA